MYFMDQVDKTVFTSTTLTCIFDLCIYNIENNVFIRKMKLIYIEYFADIYQCTKKKDLLL